MREREIEGVLAVLNARGIAYEMCEHPPLYTMEEMVAAGLPEPETMAKNLFVRDDKKREYYLISVRQETRVDLKQFALRNGTRKLSFASEEDLYALLRLTKGSVTPFGLLNDGEHRVTLYLDRKFEAGRIGIHPNRNTATVWLATDDLVALIRERGNTVIFTQID